MTKYLKILKKASSVAIFSHISPDPDTIGSTLALRRILMLMGKSVDVFVAITFQKITIFWMMQKPIMVS